MSNYIKTTNFAAKDSLPSGNPAKIVKGTEINTEFDNIAVASATKLNSSAVSTFGGTLIDDADASAARTTLGLGTAATTASTDYATAAQGTTADAALPRTGGAMTGAITTNSTFDGRDVATDGTKLDGIEAGADVTDTTNVTAAGALMDSEVTNLAQVKTFDSADYATAAQGATADAALPLAGGALTGAVTTTSTFDGRDVSVDGAKLDGIESGATADQTAAEIKTAYESNANTNAFTDADETKLDGIEAGADVTDTTNVTAAGALMDSEVTNLAQVKAFDSSDYATAAQGTTADSALQNVVDDTTPQLGGDLDLNSSDITGTGNIDITGTATMDGLTVDGVAKVLGTAGNTLIIADATETNGYQIKSNTSASSDFGFLIEDLAGKDLLKIESNNDISFYEDTGTTPKFFWDASTERLGIGNTSPATTLDVTGTATMDGLTVSGDINGPATNNLAIRSKYSATIDIDSDNNQTDRNFQVIHDGSKLLLKAEESGDISFYEDTGTTPKFFWDASAESLGIGTSPSYPLHVAGETGIELYNATGGGDVLNLRPSLGDANKYNMSISSYDHSGGGVGPADGISINAFDGVSIATGSSTARQERMRIDSSGNLLVGKTASSLSTAGHQLFPSGAQWSTVSNARALLLNRLSSDGDIAEFRKDGTSVGSIGTNSGNIYLTDGARSLIVDGDTVKAGYSTGSNADNAQDLGSASVRWRNLHLSGAAYVATDGVLSETAEAGSTFYFSNNNIGLKAYSYITSNRLIPCDENGANRDNYVDLGQSNARFDDIYAANGTIQTSDRNEKQDIAELSDAEQRVAVACKGLLRKFRWKSAVEEKGDEARIHFGIIAQDLQAAFAAEGLDAGDYGMFISTTWTDEETNEEKTRLGVRYSELLAFIISAL
jgi:hypothetical protein